MDRAGNPRGAAFGTSRGGLWSHHVLWLPISKVTPHEALCPVNVVYRAEPTNQEVNYYLGQQRDIAVCNMGLVAEGDTIEVGGDEWIVFPWASKQRLQIQTEESWRAGFAYRKVT